MDYQQFTLRARQVHRRGKSGWSSSDNNHLSGGGVRLVGVLSVFPFQIPGVHDIVFSHSLRPHFISRVANAVGYMPKMRSFLTANWEGEAAEKMPIAAATLGVTAYRKKDVGGAGAG
jgi:hypothetical protein